MARFLMPLPAQDFDPTEAAIPWQVLTNAGHQVDFATPEGAPGAADQVMLDGVGLDPWGQIPVLRSLRLFGALLRANKTARHAYRAMAASPAFQQPKRWSEVRKGDYDALILPGGHRARGMRAYLESETLQALTAAFFAAAKPVGAICHGVVLAARSKGVDGASVLAGRKTTALTWRQERAADGIARIGRWWDPGYYRTYPDPDAAPAGEMSVEAEVRRALEPDGSFLDALPSDRRKTIGLRDTATDDRPAFVVVDGNYVSARWPGDAHSFARTLMQITEKWCSGRDSNSRPAV